VYDGNTTALVTLNDNRFPGDELNTAYASASFSDKNAGTNKSVAVSGITLNGAAASNYVFNSNTVTSASILAAPLLVSAGGVNQVYDGTSVATVILSDNRVAGDQFTTSYAAASFVDQNIGTHKNVSVSGISLS